MFRADPKMVKEQIEVLIRDEYMKRDDNDKTVLIYLPWAAVDTTKVAMPFDCNQNLVI